MYTILFHPKDEPGKKQALSEELQESIHPQHEVNVTDGGEFLDDALRMKEQPLGDVVGEGE